MERSNTITEIQKELAHSQLSIPEEQKNKAMLDSKSQVYNVLYDCFKDGRLFFKRSLFFTTI